MARILVVDDDENFREVLRQMIGKLGHDIIEARNGKEAAAVFPTKKVDVVLTDLLMPQNDGFEMIRFVRRHAPTVGLIAMSGGGKIGAARYLEMAEHLGVDGVLVKPFSKSDLERAIAEALLDRPR